MIMKPPVAQKRPQIFTQHGQNRIDDYAWFKDKNWQDVMRDPVKLDPEIRAYLEAENKHTTAWSNDNVDLRNDLLAEMRGRIKEDESTVPARDGDYEYATRYEPGGQYPIFTRRNTAGLETVLLHGDKEAEGQSFFRIGGCTHSTDHKMLAYAVDLNGSERYDVKIRDLESGHNLADSLPDASGSMAWAADGETLFYTILDENHRPYRVMRHTVGDTVINDAIVYEETDPGFFLGLGKSQSGRFLEISAYDHTTSEVHLLDARNPNGDLRVVAPRDTGVEYQVAQIGESLFINTNADGAVDFKIVETPLTNPGRENWRDLVPHEPGRLIRTLLEFKNHLVRLERIAGLPRIIVRHVDTGAEYPIEFSEDVYELGLIPGYEFETDILRFTYSSMTTPSQTYDFNILDQSRDLRQEQEVPSGHDPAAYITRRLSATSHDGVDVPISLLYHKDTPLDGSAPVLLYGYGSYGMSMPASFSTNRYSLVDRGYIYAIAHVRGGTEKGYGWYLDGKLQKKQNTFLDFIAAADHMIEENLTRPGRIAIHGGSAGGMLVGACANMRPSLWGAVVGEVPFVDVLTTMCDTDLPLTPPEWPEWGNPIESAEAYNYIKSYSPVDNVTAQAYPPMLVTAGLTDPRVTYWEPAKWVAKLRALKTDTNPLYLHTNMTAGHAGAAGRFDRLEEVALVYAFLLEVMNAA